jgi:hypothetical protein
MCVVPTLPLKLAERRGGRHSAEAASRPLRVGRAALGRENTHSRWLDANYALRVSVLVRSLNVLAFGAFGLAPAQTSLLSASSEGLGARQRPSLERNGTADHLITASAMGQARLNMTLDEARRALRPASFARASDGDGAAFVEVTFAKGDSLMLWANEDDPAAPIDWSKRIVTIETFSAAFHTREGVHPGSPVRDVIKSFGPVLEIVEGEIESRQYITFTRQPKAFTFRLDYTGIFTSGVRRTTRFEPDAKLWSIAISSLS